MTDTGRGPVAQRTKRLPTATVSHTPKTPGETREVPLPAVRREPPYREHRLELNPGHRLQHGLPQPATLTISPLDIDQTQIDRPPGSAYLPKTTVTGTARTRPGK
jgi:hypothetical protein